MSSDSLVAKPFDRWCRETRMDTWPSGIVRGTSQQFVRKRGGRIQPVFGHGDTICRLTATNSNGLYVAKRIRRTIFNVSVCQAKRRSVRLLRDTATALILGSPFLGVSYS